MVLFLQIIEVAVDVEEEFTVGDEGEPVAQPREEFADVVEGGGALQPHVGEVMLSALSVVVTHFFFILHVQIVALKEQNLIKIQNVIQGDHDGRRLGFVDYILVIPPSAPFCLGCCKLGKNGRGVEQHCATSKIKSTKSSL